MVRTLINVPRVKIDVKKARSRYKDCLNDIRKHISSADNTAPDTVHDLRVSLKKTDALIALLRFNKNNPAPKKLRAFTSLFKAAGKLRSIQVEFDIINKHFKEDVNPNYLHQLHEMKVKRTEEYSKLLEKMPRSVKEASKPLKKKIEEITRRQILGYLHSEEKYLERRLSRSIFREQELHFVRKDLKRLYLNLLLCGHERKDLDNLVDLLGSWHDHQIAFDHVVKTIYTGQLTEPESEPIRNIKQQLINDKELLYVKTVSYYVANKENGQS